jgi:hypothetical protein
VACEHCGERQPLTIQQAVLEWDELGRPVRWNEVDGQVVLICRTCGKPMNRLGPGEWVATWPEREIAGFHLSKLFSPTADLGALVQALITTDETKRREAYNQDLGEPYTPKGGQMTDEVLDGLRREYAHGAVKLERTVLGADVGRVLHVVIRGQPDPESGERPQRWAGEVESFEALGRLIRQFNVERAVIDALPETRKARELQAAFKQGVVWLAYYVGQKTGTHKSESAQWDHANGTVNLDRTRTLDQTFGRFYDGEATLPADARAIRDYYAHLKASVRALQDSPGGQAVAVYIESGPDHLAHAENYCMVASLEQPVKMAGVWGRRR